MKEMGFLEGSQVRAILERLQRLSGPSKDLLFRGLGAMIETSLSKIDKSERLDYPDRR